MENQYNNDATKDEKSREDYRRQQMKKAMGGGTEDSQEQKSEENIENSEKKLDNDEKNSYINDKSDDKTEPQGNGESTAQEEFDEEKQKLQAILDESFNGDPLKVAKSWREIQSSYNKLRQQAKQLEGETQAMKDVLNENPRLKELMKKAFSGELSENEFQNFSNESQESGKDKSNYSNTNLDAYNVDVSTLTKEGYIDSSKLDLLSPDERKVEIQRAKLAYLEETLPKRVLEKTEKQIAERKRLEQEKQKREETIKTNENRFLNGVEQVLDEYRLDLAGEHKDLYDEIEKVAWYIRDPENKNLIDEDAVTLATEKVLRRKGIRVNKEPEKKEQQKQSFTGQNQFNSNKRETPNRKTPPKTFADKMREKRLNDYKEQLDRRRSIRRSLQT